MSAMVLLCVQEMMYIWNGYTVIGKHRDLTEAMLKTLDEAQATLDSSPSKHKPLVLEVQNMSRMY